MWGQFEGSGPSKGVNRHTIRFCGSKTKLKFSHNVFHYIESSGTEINNKVL